MHVTQLTLDSPEPSGTLIHLGEHPGLEHLIPRDIFSTLNFLHTLFPLSVVVIYNP
jgi:hypothetical protein